MTTTLTPPGPLPVVKHRAADKGHFHAGRWENGKLYAITYIVLHNTVGTNSLDWLSTTSKPPVSIHALVDDTEPFTCWGIVAPADTAYHVGCALDPYDNPNCLGVEIENLSDPSTGKYPYPEGQLNVVAHRVACWLYSYGLTWETAVVRHGDIAVYCPDKPNAGKLGRRADPYTLDTGPGSFLYQRTHEWLTFFHQVPPEDLHEYLY